MTIPFGMFDNVPDEDERKWQLMAKLFGPTRAAAVKRIGNIEYSPEEEANGLGLTKGEQQYRTARQIAEFVKEFTPMGDGEALGRVAEDVVKGRSRGWETAGDALSVIPVVGALGDARRAGKAAAKLERGASEAAEGGARLDKYKKTGKIASIRDMTPEQALKAARKGEHLKQSPDGQFVGAPRGVTTEKDLRKIRRSVDAQVESGVSGGDWYDRARDGIVETSGPDVKRQRLFSQELAFWSPQSTPETNLNDALRARMGYEVGKPYPLVRTGRQASVYKAARDAGEDIKLGPKTGEFENKLNPTVPYSHIPVNDIWQGRVFGYTNADGTPISSGYTPQMHAFMDAETTLAADRANKRALGGRTDWNAASVQASPWVAAKGQSLHERFPQRFPTVADGIKEASKTYNDYFPKHTVFGTYEAIPGQNTGHLPGIVDMPEEVRKAYSNDPRSSWMTPEGNDMLYSAQNIQNRKTNSATGAYRNSAGEMEFNPANAARPLIGFGEDQFGKIIEPESREMLNAVEGFRAFMDGQEAGAWHKMIPEQQGSVSRSLMVPTSGPQSPENMRKISDVAREYGFGVSDTGESVSLMNNRDIFDEGGPANGKELMKQLKGGLAGKIAEAIPNQSGPATRARLQSDYLPTLLGAENEGTGKATQNLLSLINPTIAAKFDADPALRQAALNRIDRDVEFAAANNLPLREDLQTARRIFAESGVEGLKRALQAGVILPAAGLMVMRASQGGSTPEAGPPGA